MDDDDFWAAIESAGPLVTPSTFDPLAVADVIQAEREAAQFDRRRAFVAGYSWAIPTRDAIRRVRQGVGERAVLEVCAGMGLWAKLLAQTGLQVIATDWAGSPASSHYLIEKAEAEAAVNRYPECQALLLCWPPFKETCAFRALRTFAGDCVVHVGDVRFTAERQFYELLETSWQTIDCFPLPSWPGTADGVSIYARKPSA